LITAASITHHLTLLCLLMEENQNLNTEHSLPPKNLIVERKAKIHLRTISIWTRYISIAIGLAFFILLCFVIYNYYNDWIVQIDENLSPNYKYYHIASIISLVLVFYPIFRLYQFSRYIDHAILFRDNSDLTKAFRHLKSFAQVIGIITTILIIAYISLLVYAGLWLA
jgi:hypothetical protein